MQIVDTTRQSWDLVLPNTRGGDVFRKVIRSAEGGRRVSYDVRIEQFGEGDRGYTSIRHRHDFEQLRFAAEGKMDLGFAVLETGDVAYFPANAYYGPQRCEGSIILIAQWGDRFITKEDSDRAVAELSAHGEFSDGIYRSVTPDGRPFNKDPLNAIWEQVFQEPYVPQKPRYRQPVVMTPSAFGWGEPEGAVHRRRLGTFSENALTIETVGWLKDGALRLEFAEGDNRPTLLFTTAGSFGHDGTSFGPLTALWSETATRVEVDGTSGSELLMVRFPDPSSRITLGLAG
jgi:hypothetical protein